MSTVMLPPAKRPVAYPLSSGKICSPDRLYTHLRLQPYKLWVATYTYNPIVLDWFSPRITRLIYAVSNGVPPTYARQLSNNHSKIILGINDTRNKPVVVCAWLGSGNFVGPNVLYDFFISIPRDTLGDIAIVYNELWEMSVPLRGAQISSTGPTI